MWQLDNSAEPCLTGTALYSLVSPASGVHCFVSVPFVSVPTEVLQQVDFQMHTADCN